MRQLQAMPKVFFQNGENTAVKKQEIRKSVIQLFRKRPQNFGKNTNHLVGKTLRTLVRVFSAFRSKTFIPPRILRLSVIHFKKNKIMHSMIWSQPLAPHGIFS